MAGIYSLNDVSSHSSPDDLWIVVDSNVFDVTKFQYEHPGGEKILQKVAGKDASKQFRKHHSVHILGRFKEDLHVGTLNRAQDEAPRKAMLFRFIRWK